MASKYIKTKYEGVYTRGSSIIIDFRYLGNRYRMTLKGLKLTSNNLKVASNKRGSILTDIHANTFDFGKYFPNSVNAKNLSTKPSRSTVGELLTKWLKQQTFNLMPSSKRTYYSRFNTHVFPRWKDVYVDVIKKSEIEDWIALKLQQEIANKTINNVLIGLRAVFDRAEGDGLIGKNIMNEIDELPVADSEPDPFTNSEILQIRSTETPRRSEKNAFLFCCYTGLSLSEMLALAWEDVDIENGIINVRRATVEKVIKVPKEKARKRQIELIDEAKEILLDQLDLTSTHPHFDVEELQIDRRTFIKRSLQFVFLNTKDKKTWSYFEKDQEFRNQFFKGFLAKVGIRYRGPNTARHTYASRLLTVGVPTEWLALQMGHTTTKMIEKHYGRWIRENRPDMASHVSKLLNNK